MEVKQREIVDHLYTACRLCLQGDGTYPIIPSSSIHIDIADIFGVKVEPSDGLSQLLCSVCQDRLLEIQNLRAKYIMNQEILRVLMNTRVEQFNKNNTTEIKLEPDDEMETEELPEQVNRGTPTTTDNNVHSTSMDQCPSDVDETNQSCSQPESATERESEEYNYSYHCRFCSVILGTLSDLKEHLKCHSDLIRIKRHITPHNCNVKLMRLQNEPSNDLSEPYHPHFFVKRIRKLNSDIFENINSTEDSDEDNNEDSTTSHITDESKGESDHNLSTQCGLDFPNSVTDDTNMSLKCEADISQNSYLGNNNCMKTEDHDIDSMPDLVYLPDYDMIMKTISPRVIKHLKKLDDTEMIQVHMILLQMCKQNMKLIWKKPEKDECPTINLELLSLRGTLQSKHHSNLSGYSALKKVNKNKNKKKTSPLTSKAHTDVPQTIVAAKSSTRTPNGDQLAVIEEATLPIIVSSESLQPDSSLTSNSTAHYVDLDDTNQNISSNESPLIFLKNLLQGHGLAMTLLNINIEVKETVLCCFKKKIENRSFLVTLFIKDSTFYLEVMEDKDCVNLEQENDTTQWQVLKWLFNRQTEVLIRNYAKRSPSCCENVDKFLKIGRSISGTTSATGTLLEAPSKFFF